MTYELTPKQLLTIAQGMARAYGGDVVLRVRYDGFEAELEVDAVAGGCIDFRFGGGRVRLTYGEPRKLFTIVGIEE